MVMLARRFGGWKLLGFLTTTSALSRAMLMIGTRTAKTPILIGIWMGRTTVPKAPARAPDLGLLRAARLGFSLG
jgi:hypothetical protein